MKLSDFNDIFVPFFMNALRIRETIGASCLLLITEEPLDWAQLRQLAGGTKVIIAAQNLPLTYFDPVDKESEKPVEKVLPPPAEGQKAVAVPPLTLLQEAEKAGFHTVTLESGNPASIYYRLRHSLLMGAAKDLIPHHSKVVALYSGLDSSMIDTISILNLGDHLERLSAKELKKLEKLVPLRTLQRVVDLALEIGREGREEKRIGTVFVVGDTKNVMQHSRPGGFDPVRGYKCKERTLSDAKVREGIKEVAQLDGAFVIARDGVVMAACRMLDIQGAIVSLSKGLGSRHWAAAAISKMTSAVAIAVSQSSGTVRIFVNGEVILRIESRDNRQPVVWRDFDSELSGMND